MIRLLGDSRNLWDCIIGGIDYGHDLEGIETGVPCVVGSPPYNVAIPNYPSGYEDHLPWPLYKAYALQWSRSIASVLCSGGRAWVNVQQTVPKVPGVPGGARVNMAQLWMWALDKAGLHYRDTICWVQDSFDGACAWGSWCQPSAPNLRGSSELILLYYKDRWNRPIPPEWKGKPQPREELGGSWEDLVRNVWKINPANTRTGGQGSPAGQPAVFPIELPARAIRLSTWPGEWVVDPWAGHCTTARAADELGRPSVMVDIGYDNEEPT